MKLICSTVFVYFGDEGYKKYSTFLKNDGASCLDCDEIDGNTYEFRCWVMEELDLPTLVHELNHLTDNVCIDRGISTDEGRAYVQGYIFGEVMRKRRIIAYKEKPCKK